MSNELSDPSPASLCCQEQQHSSNKVAIKSGKVIGSLKLINTSCFLSCAVATGISLAFSCPPFRPTRMRKGNRPSKSGGWWGRLLCARQGDQNLTASSHELSKDEGCGKPVNTDHLWWFVFFTPLSLMQED